MVEPFTVVASVVASMALSALVAVRVASRPGSRPDHDAAQMGSCAVCGEPGTREDLRDHLRELHNAPGARAELDELIEPLEVG